MTEIPKCPGCGREMVPIEDFHKYFYACLDCGWKSPYGQNEKEGLDLALKRAEPKNRVLTLEEVAKSEVMWYDDRLRTRARVVILGWGRCEPDFTKLVDRCGDEFYRKNASYNDFWRCWLRKPTEAERRETPWAGDSRE